MFPSRRAGYGATLTVTLRVWAGAGSAGVVGSAGTGDVMGLITERDGAAGSTVTALPDAPAAEPGTGGAALHRRSPLATKRSVLYVLSGQDAFVAEDLVTWYIERGFHFYVADLRDGGPSGRQDCLAWLDGAARQLRDCDAAEMIVVSAHSAGALTAAVWCDARRDAGLADALILCNPQLGRRLRRGLDITCPVLMMCPAADSPSANGPGARGTGIGRRAARLRRRPEGAVRLGAHVTWLLLGAGLPGQPPDAGDGRRRFFDEMGRWLGAYMYGKVRDQLL